MSVQTSYGFSQARGLPGLIYALHDQDIDSFSVEGTDGIDFGMAVSRGTNAEKQVVLGGDPFLGITVRSVERASTDATGSIGYAEKETAAIMRKGYIWVICPTGCNPGDPVNYNTTTGALDSGAAEAGEAAITGATWETSAVAGEIAVVRLV